MKKATTKRRTATPVQQSRVAMPQMRRAERWMVLTSWDGTERPRMVLAVTEERVISTFVCSRANCGRRAILQT